MNYLGANRNFSDDDVNLNSAKEADIFYFTGYMWDTESQQKAIRKVLEKKKKLSHIFLPELYLAPRISSICVPLR